MIERLPSLVADGAPPALIHGDLWSGNALGSTRGPALVDPACAYADREAELGMMTLFGGFDRHCFAAYEEAFPLPAGWRERNGLYQLYHVLNHHALFGGHYGAAGAGARAPVRLRASRKAPERDLRRRGECAWPTGCWSWRTTRSWPARWSPAWPRAASSRRG